MMSPNMVSPSAMSAMPSAVGQPMMMPQMPFAASMAQPMGHHGPRFSMQNMHTMDPSGSTNDHLAAFNP